MNELNFETMLNDYLNGDVNIGDKLEATLIRKNSEYGYLNVNSKLEGRIKISEIENLEIGEKLFVQVMRKDDEFLIVSKNVLERNEAFKAIKINDILEATIIEKIKGGYKVKLNLVDAYLPFKFSGEGQNLEIGSKYLVEVIEKTNKNLVVSRTNIIQKAKDEFLNSHKVGDIVKGTVISILDFGLIINLGSINGLLHVSEISWNKDNSLKEKALKEFKIGDIIETKIIEILSDENKVKLSIKELSENPWLKIKEKYKVGQNIDAPIKKVLNFGVIVDLGEEEGFIKIRELYYKGVNNISKEYKIGDIIFAEVIEINDEKERIFLSSKTIFEKIWNDIENIHFPNDIINVTIKSIKDFGFFARTNENLEVLIPKSEYSWNKDEKLNLKLNDNLEVKLIRIDKENKNLIASIKQLGKSPFEIASSKFELNKEYELEVTNILENGILVKLTDDFKGLIPRKEVSKENVKDINEIIKVGDKVKAILFNKDANKRSILLSLRRREEREERRELEELLKEYGAN